MPSPEKTMERIERKPNPVRRKIIRYFLLLAVIIAMVYGYTRIPYFVVKRNLTLQNNYTYETYEKILEKRALYLSEEYIDRFNTYNSMLERKQYIKDHKESCRLIRLELGKRRLDGSIPYTAIYELSYEDGENKTQKVHVEGIQVLERNWLVWWKVCDNLISHSCTDLDAEDGKVHE